MHNERLSIASSNGGNSAKGVFGIHYANQSLAAEYINEKGDAYGHCPKCMHKVRGK